MQGEGLKTLLLPYYDIGRYQKSSWLLIYSFEKYRRPICRFHVTKALGLKSSFLKIKYDVPAFVSLYFKSISLLHTYPPFFQGDPRYMILPASFYPHNYPKR